jgi:hypothetical protein
MRRVSVSLLLGVFALLLVSAPAAAGRAWCARDPLVRVDGTEVQIWVAIPQEFEPYVKDKVKMKIAVPKGSSRQVLFTDEGFNGHGEEVNWGDAKPTSDGSKPMDIEVHVIVDQGRIDKAFGKNTVVPVQVIVNVGTETQTIDYATTKNNKFSIDLHTLVDTEATP